MANILATVAAPTGILSAIDKRAAQRNQTHAQLLSRAGLVQADWDALATALGGANAANLRRLLNASHAAICVMEQPTAIPEFSAASHNGPIVSHFGDLS
ncbi:hypothetical protein [Methylocystis sp. SB2]|uniref:hypothetical protein n=1 Tax=Methylocystis sp. (strain SB2) TaxID=743836 RepID=UPI000404B0DD|nr:hypothetical protein [Methylocystis sp. SB2]ULO23799.1 hypothetical protein LNB28_17055 [Methylocystis sp. SB2]